MINPFKWLVDLIAIKSDDPMTSCDVYINCGCAGVDGILCDVNDCTILRQYRQVQDNGNKKYESTK